MELRVYDANLNLLGFSEDQISAVWNRKYFECGDFKLTLPITSNNINLYQIGNIVSFRETDDAGLIEDIQIVHDNNKATITASGRFLAAYMDRRLIKPTITFSGLAEVAMRSLLMNVTTIPLVELGDLQGFQETAAFQATYKNLLSYEEKLSLAYNIGFRFRPDFVAKKIYFETYRGTDRSRNQSENSWVEFSDAFDNIDNSEARLNDQLLKTVAWVGGQGQGGDRVFVQVGDDTITGLNRREYFIDARDMQEEDVGERPNENDYMENVTVDGQTVTHFKEAEFNAALAYWQSEKARARREYIAALTSRGEQKMAECVFSKSIECDIIPYGNFEYKRDYNLGDIVTVRKMNWGYEATQRITEISEVYEHGNAIVTPVLGTALPTTIDWEDK